MKKTIETPLFKGVNLALVLLVVNFAVCGCALRGYSDTGAGGQPSVAQDPKAAPPTEKYKTTVLSGAVSLIEADGTLVIIDASRKTTLLYVKKETALTKDGKPAKFSDIKIGDLVNAKYAGANVAIEIRIGGDAAK
ncbi:hypothetical protein EPN96_09355 [bacterium]|nr:MAG: hypothetical protein EPN96_09355 [bacterium]